MAMYGTKLPYRPTEADRKELRRGQLEILDLAREPEKIQEPNAVLLKHYSPLDFIQAIDPDTGDSVLHILSRSASVDAISEVMATFDTPLRDWPRRRPPYIPGHIMLFWLTRTMMVIRFSTWLRAQATKVS